MKERNKTVIPFFVLLVAMLVVFLGTVYLFLSEEERAVVEGKIFKKEASFVEKNKPDGFLAERQLCQEQEDCVPLPSCHPIECINKKFEQDFSRPVECSVSFNPAAVYEKRDCACQEGRCVNGNADKK